jgi:hypothetical protein
MRKIPLLLLLCVVGFAAHAKDHFDHDDAPFYEGVWNVRFVGQRSARFELRDWAGTWRETGAQKDLPAACRGKKFPVSIHHSTTEELDFTVWGSSVNPACPDTRYVFNPRDDKTLEAPVEPGGKATMTRLRP